MGPSPVYLVTDPALIAPIVKANEAQIDKGRIVHKLRKMLGMSSITMSGAEHRERRAIIHKHLSRGMANAFVPEISSTVRSTAILLSQENSFDAHSITAPLALRIISSICFGRDTLSPGDEAILIEAVNHVEDDLANSFFKLIPDMPWHARARAKRFQHARDMMLAVVKRSKQRCNSSSLMNALESLNMSEEDLRDEILMIFLAGHHTTGNAAVWLLYYLAKEPQIAQQLSDEALSIMKNGELDPEKLVRADKSLRFVKEVLRLYPSFYWFSREAKQQIEIGGRSFKKGTTFIISQWHLQRDPRYWDHPDDFDINRSYAASAYLPFGAGPRVCVGMGVGIMELQIMALEFASAFTIELLSEEPLQSTKGSVTIVPPPINLRLHSKAINLVEAVYA